MANHVRTQVRDAVVTALAGLTTTGSRVYAGRVRQLTDANLPGLSVYTTSEEIDHGDDTGVIGTRKLTRRITLTIEATVKAVGDVDSTLDTIAKEVETALSAVPTLGGLAKDMWLQSQEKELDGASESKIGSLVMEYLIIVRTAENAPDVAIA